MPDVFDQFEEADFIELRSVRQSAYRDILDVVRDDPRETLRLAAAGADLDSGMNWSLIDACLREGELTIVGLADRLSAGPPWPPRAAEADNC